MMEGDQVRVVAERTFDSHVHSVREARHFAEAAVLGTGADPATTALLTSEIATNAVLHARTPFRVRVIEVSDHVRVEISNDEPELLLAMKDPSEHGGRGLRIVDQLANHWGAESSRGDKVVWFELRRLSD
jgi:anti-sigma regulatory factor (Ser/Thr protein kinase)